MYSSFSHYAPFLGEIAKRNVGSMISQENGKSMRYAMWKLQDR
jgi:GTP-binding protein